MGPAWTGNRAARRAPARCRAPLRSIESSLVVLFLRATASTKGRGSRPFTPHNAQRRDHDSRRSPRHLRRSWTVARGSEPGSWTTPSASCRSADRVGRYVIVASTTPLRASPRRLLRVAALEELLERL